MREWPLQRQSGSCTQTAQQSSLRCCTKSAAVLCSQPPDLYWPNASAYCPSHAFSACGLHQKACRALCRTSVDRCQMFAPAPASSCLSRAPFHTFHVSLDLPHPTRAEFHSDGRASCILAQIARGRFSACFIYVTPPPPRGRWDGLCRYRRTARTVAGERQCLKLGARSILPSIGSGRFGCIRRGWVEHIPGSSLLVAGRS